MTTPDAPPVCRNCGKTPLIRAHIIPQAFGRMVRGDADSTRELTSDFTRKAQLGIYDDKILCAACDGKLGIFDKYAFEFCRDFEKNHTRRRSSRGSMFSVPGADAEKLAKFFLAVLWRASISSRHEFNEVKFGRREEEIREMLFADPPKPIEQLRCYEVFISRYEPNEFFPLDRIYSLPARNRGGPYGFYRLVIGGFAVTAKIDPRPAQRSLQQIALNGRNGVRGIFERFQDTLEFQAFRKFSLAHKDKIFD